MTNQANHHQSPEYIAELLFLQLQGKLTGAQEQELETWKMDSPSHRETCYELSDAGKVLDEVKKLQNIKASIDDGLRAKGIPLITDNTIKQPVTSLVADMESTGHPVPVRGIQWLPATVFRWAAIFIVLLGAGTYLFMRTSPAGTAKVNQAPLAAAENLLPGTDKAILTLSDGQEVELNKSAPGTINDGVLSIAHHNGQLSYENASSVAMNTMTTPRGSQYQLVLNDGTKVWLNAASAITYPTKFTGNTREVKVSGEVYFEVAKNPSHPFLVHTGKEEITVLGTSFNVKTYPDEPFSKISLAEGSIKVNNKILKEGEAITRGNIRPTNIQHDIAWKNNLLIFDNQSIEEILRPIARWYDVEIKYSGKINTHFWGSVPRNLKLKKVLEILEKTGGIKFEINDRVLIVKP